MSDDDTDGSAPTANDQEPGSIHDAEERPPEAEAKRYARLAAEQPTTIHGEERRLVELLCPVDQSEPVESVLARRRAASTALVRLASDDGSRIDGHIGTLLEELRRERTRDLAADRVQLATVSRAITDTLVATIALAIAEQPETVADIDDLSGYADAITTDLETETLRTVAKAFFAGAPELQRPAVVVDVLGELITYPDSVVRTWTAGAVGRLAENYPDEAATTAGALRHLVEHDDATVRHNAVEALGALVGERPDAVVPAADTLRELLTHEDVAIQHNAAGVLAHLVKTQPDAVIPAIDDLRELRTHDDEALRRIATGTLVGLARERPAVVDDTVIPDSRD